MKSARMAMAILLPAGVAFAGPCVDAKSAKNGLILTRPGIQSEFRPVAGGMIAVANSYESHALRRLSAAACACPEDEVFHILDGRLRFQIDGRERIAVLVQFLRKAWHRRCWSATLTQRNRA
ncbi:hypothetical protein [Mesorhizobium sp. B2-4-19]|uniref:hypothetical protein n=1 Tax=Mesorhizobium sp. B2-4-19 TaxID=2589930 RepID=UPI001FEFFDDA|nr:hypothetical protein [Mesorhizobium sp. B2-4-19]